MAYDPVAIKEFQKYYNDLKLRFVENCEDALAQADLLAITTAWPEFADLRERTNKAVVDCRYML